MNSQSSFEVLMRILVPVPSRSRSRYAQLKRESGPPSRYAAQVVARLTVDMQHKVC